MDIVFGHCVQGLAELTKDFKKLGGLGLYGEFFWLCGPVSTSFRKPVVPLQRARVFGVACIEHGANELSGKQSDLGSMEIISVSWPTKAGVFSSWL